MNGKAGQEFFPFLQEAVVSMMSGIQYYLALRKVFQNANWVLFNMKPATSKL